MNYYMIMVLKGVIMFENYLMLKIIEEKYKELKLDKKDINNIF